MNQQEKRVKIAEASGWKLANRVLPECANNAIMCWIRPGDSEWEESQIPDYFNDLNAMREVEDILTPSEEQLYFETLHETAGNTMFYRATAAQRAEAFGKTLNLW
jgi:hypothetical protein